MKYWNIPVTPYLTDVLEKAVELGFHVSKVDLVRCVIREKLSNMGLKEELEIILADLKHQRELEKKREMRAHIGMKPAKSSGQ